MQENNEKPELPSDRVAVLAIAYHNLAVGHARLYMIVDHQRFRSLFQKVLDFFLLVYQRASVILEQVQEEFLGRYRDAMVAYQKSVKVVTTHLEEGMIHGLILQLFRKCVCTRVTCFTTPLAEPMHSVKFLTCFLRV